MPITLNNLSYTYAKGTSLATDAVKGISLTIADGEFVGIMGRTGCGKSTLIQLIAGLLKPTTGTVLLDGQDIHDRRYDRDILRRRVGVVFQYPEYQLFETTVERDVAFGLRHFGWSKEQVRQAVREALEAVGFDYEAVRDKSPLGFSGGEKRRIAIAGVLAAKPAVLILDEPVAGLDPLGRDAFLSLLDRLNKNGVTILMISHNVDALAEHAERILLLQDGALCCDGPTVEVLANQQLLAAHRMQSSQAAAVAAALRQRGLPVPQGIVRYEELLPCLIALGRGRRT